MGSSLGKHGDKVNSPIMGSNRLMFKGRLQLGWREAVERLLGWQGLRIKDFRGFVGQAGTPRRPG